MPIYEFECAMCEHRWEELAKYEDSPPPCEKCGELSVDRLFPSSTSFQLKGSGWFADGYGSSKEKNTQD